MLNYFVLLKSCLLYSFEEIQHNDYFAHGWNDYFACEWLDEIQTYLSVLKLQKVGENCHLKLLIFQFLAEDVLTLFFYLKHVLYTIQILL